MQNSSDRPSLRQLDKKFLDHLSAGDRLFHYPRTGNAETSFQDSPSTEYTLYSVIEVPTDDDIVMLRAFDLDEQKQHFSRADLLAGDWWYIPE